MEKMKYSGLTSAEAKKIIYEKGFNEIQRRKKVSPLKILLEQFKSPLILILILSVVVLFIVDQISSSNNFLDMVLILLIVLVSGVSGFAQDYKAEKSIEALQKMSEPRTKVLRDGVTTIIPTREVVPGDLLILEEGDFISADSIIIKTDLLQVDESSLTGESRAVDKKEKDKIFRNTYVISGRCVAKVISTGMKTRIGEIAKKIENIQEEKTPFYIQMNRLSKRLFWIVILIAIITALLGLFRYSVSNSILIAVALAVAAIPEGLPAVLVLSLAGGSKVMLKKNALVRRLSVIESIGSVNYICTDKTGTITKNEMSVTKIYSNDEESNYNLLSEKDNKELLLCGTLNNNSKEVLDKERTIVGDETDIAIRKFGLNFGYNKSLLEKSFKRISEIPFDPKRKMMSVIVSSEKGKNLIYTKGAPEEIIERCNRILINGKVFKLASLKKKKILKLNNKFASEGLRVIGFAYNSITNFSGSSKHDEKNLIFIGLEGIIDPPREGVLEAISQCESAGVNVLMLTGDNPLTAKVIASRVGINSGKILSGNDVEKLEDKKLYEKISSGYKIFARLTPEHKLKIMSVLQVRGNIVAMTGDGVNDALALKKADVGVAMGVRGTDVAKESSDLVLLDDNFVTIVSAISEGRRIFDNIKKFTNYLLTSNFAEVLVIFFATAFLTLKEPILLPVQLLWINLLTDGFPALALGIDPARPGIMKEPPRKKSDSIIDKRLCWLTGAIGIKKTLILFATFFLTLYLTKDSSIARTTLFTGFVLYEFVRVAVIRQQEKLNWLSNKFLLWALVISIILQIVIIYTPINNLFGISSMGITSWSILICGIILAYALAIWITKIIVNKFKE